MLANIELCAINPTGGHPEIDIGWLGGGILLRIDGRSAEGRRVGGVVREVQLNGDVALQTWLDTKVQ